MGELLPEKDMPASGIIPFGKRAKAEFPLDPHWHNLNHGSFGSTPKAVQAKMREYQSMAEARPDAFLRYDYPPMLDKSRAMLAELVHAPVETVVLVSNTTDGVNTVLRNLRWEDGDVIVCFSTVYGACGKAGDYIVDYHNGKVSIQQIQLTYPVEDEEILAQFREAVREIGTEGKRARICIFDTVTSLPGLCFPWQDMVKACRELGVLSLVDGAHGVGMLSFDLTAADPDFFVSNCHKWLHVPRSCALFYVPERNHHLLPTTLSTSHGYVPQLTKRSDPLPPKTNSAFVNNFAFVGTRDDAAYLCVKDALEWRRDVMGGEDRIQAYLLELNKTGCRRVAEVLETEILDNRGGTLSNSALGNVRLPLWVGGKGEGAKASDFVVPENEAMAALLWMEEALVSDHQTFMSLVFKWDRYWVRLSAQVYLDLDDYDFAAAALKDVCERVAKGEHRGSQA